MVFSFVVLALAVAGANALTINTPSGPLNECENAQLTWDGAPGRTQISVYPLGVTSGPTLETLPQQPAGTNALTWLVDLPVGSYTLVIKDLEQGASAFSGTAEVTPNPSGDRSCEGKNAQNPTTPVAPGDSTTAPGEQPTSPPTTAGGDTTPPPAGTGGSTGTTGSSPSNTSPGASNPSATQPPNGAAALSVTSATGVLGLLAAFLLA